jgi:hypothetical protein
MIEKMPIDNSANHTSLRTAHPGGFAAGEGERSQKKRLIDDEIIKGIMQA